MHELVKNSRWEFFTCSQIFVRSAPDVFDDCLFVQICSEQSQPSRQKLEMPWLWPEQTLYKLKSFLSLISFVAALLACILVNCQWYEPGQTGLINCQISLFSRICLIYVVWYTKVIKCALSKRYSELVLLFRVCYQLSLRLSLFVIPLKFAVSNVSRSAIPRSKIMGDLSSSAVICCHHQPLRFIYQDKSQFFSHWWDFHWRSWSIA